MITLLVCLYYVGSGPVHITGQMTTGEMQFCSSLINPTLSIVNLVLVSDDEDEYDEEEEQEQEVIKPGNCCYGSCALQ